MNVAALWCHVRREMRVCGMMLQNGLWWLRHGFLVVWPRAAEHRRSYWRGRMKVAMVIFQEISSFWHL